MQYNLSLEDLRLCKTKRTKTGQLVFGVMLAHFKCYTIFPDDKEISSRRKAVGVSSERRRSAPFEDDEEDAYFSLSLPFPFFPPYFEGRPPPSTAKNESQCVMQIASCTSSSNSSSIHKNTQYQHERTND